MRRKRPRMTFMHTPEFRRREQLRRNQTHCHAGHPLTPHNTREEVCSRNGREYVLRICKACERQRQRQRKKSSAR
jgi:hypothetical protein